MLTISFLMTNKQINRQIYHVYFHTPVIHKPVPMLWPGWMQDMNCLIKNGFRHLYQEIDILLVH